MSTLRDLSDNELLDLLVAVRRNCGCAFPPPEAPTTWQALRCQHTDEWLSDNRFVRKQMAAREKAREKARAGP